MSKAFELKHITKDFGNVKALNNVTLQSEEGIIFGLLGPNGAGKTTIIRILSTLLTPTKGLAKVHGIDVATEPEKVRSMIGLAGQYAAVDEFLTGYENIFMAAQLYGLKNKEAKKRSLDLLERFDLLKAANRPVRTYSGGMRRRLDVGASIVGRPRIMFLDEPTIGLDPKTRLDLWDVIRDLVDQGTSILLTTQYLEEADQLASRIAIVNKGRVIAEGTSSQLKAKLGGDIIEFRLENAQDKDAALLAIKRFAYKPPIFDEDTLEIKVPVKKGSQNLMGIVQALNTAKLKVISLSLHQPSLDDVFLTLTADKPHKEGVKKS